MKVTEKLQIKVSGPGRPPLRVVAGPLYRKSSPYNTDVYLTVEHRTTGDGYTVKLNRAAVALLADVMAGCGDYTYRLDQDSVQVGTTLKGYALGVLHYPSAVADYPAKRRVAYLDTEQRHHVADWLRRWLKEGWE